MDLRARERTAPNRERHGKRGLDRAAASLHMTPKPLTVAELSKTPPRAKFTGNLEDNQDQRIGDFERQVWSVNATIKSIQLRGDGDYYMEIEGPDGSKSVMEVPDPALCKGRPLQASIAARVKPWELDITRRPRSRSTTRQPCRASASTGDEEMGPEVG